MLFNFLKSHLSVVACEIKMGHSVADACKRSQATPSSRILNLESLKLSMTYKSS